LTIDNRRWRGLAARAVLQGTGWHGLQVRASGDTDRHPMFAVWKESCMFVEKK
jgi:hypothetical protein